MAWFHLLHVLCFLSYSNLDISTAADTISAEKSLSGNQNLLSKGGQFELGFFAPGSSSRNNYIGIWYKRRPERTYVWVANRENPVSDAASSELKISQEGNLVLLNQNKIQVWTSNLTTNSPNSTSAVLLDSGNFVLINGSDPSAIIWQSFDHPTDTWLPGSRIGWNKKTGQYMTLVSWRNSEDPSPGFYSFGLDPNGKNQFIQKWNGSEVFYSTGEWNGQYFTLVPEMTRNQVFNYTYVQSEKYLTYSLRDTSIITRFVLDKSGQGLQYAWLNNSADWMLIWTQPRAQCDVYSFCGAFGICDLKSSLICSCLQGFEPSSLKIWDLDDWTGGCVRRTQLHCSGNVSRSGSTDQFVTMPDIKFPSNSKSLAVGSPQKCMLACLNDCSCTAYAYNDQCFIWNGDLQNLQQASIGDNGTVAFNLRLAASELPGPKSRKGKVVGISIGVIAGIFILLCIFLVVKRKYQHKGSLEESNAVEGSLVAFKFSDLQRATKDFSDKLGGGGFGSVFKGLLPDSSAIAVKKLEGLGQGEKQFRTEVSTVGTIQHVNLVQLHGFCSEGDKRLLVYEYMEKGSLDHHLFRNDAEILDWKTRYQVALGTARGLAYLHEKCRDCIIHCDIKPENILLDMEFCPKVADLGMAKLVGREFSRVLTTMRGTVGYLAPEWLSGEAITPKADVYSFGMMVFEIISGRRNTRYSEEGKFVYYPIWAARKLIDGDILCLLDGSLKSEANVEELSRLCRVACWCIQDNDIDRPSMGVVVQVLEGMSVLGVPPIPRSIQHLIEDGDASFFLRRLDIWSVFNFYKS